MNEVAKRLARGRRVNNWFTIGFFVMVAVVIGLCVFHDIEKRSKDELGVIDLQTGVELVVPVVDPVNSHEIIDTASTWCAETIMDRTPTGLEHENMVPILFNPDATKLLATEFGEEKRREYASKKLHSSIEIASIDAQPFHSRIIPNGILVTVQGQVITVGLATGVSLTEVKPFRLVLTFAPNPGRNHARRYPLMCADFRVSDEDKVASK